MSAEPEHDDSCDEWCAHCTACGTSVHYGSLCHEHQNAPAPSVQDGER